jgi:hypothetical protein
MEDEKLKKIHNHINYNKEFFIGSYMMDEELINAILQWKTDNGHLGKKTVLKNDPTSKSPSKVCTEWSIENDNRFYPWNLYVEALRSCFAEYFKTYDNAKTMGLPLSIEHYNLQHYKPGEGFYLWHKENNGFGKSVFRHLVYMTYLTDTPKGGTEFQEQNLTVPCEKGVTLIWPAGWTHTHRGQISEVHEKTIVTGWLSFLPEEEPGKDH